MSEILRGRDLYRGLRNGTTDATALTNHDLKAILRWNNILIAAYITGTIACIGLLSWMGGQA